MSVPNIGLGLGLQNLVNVGSIPTGYSKEREKMPMANQGDIVVCEDRDKCDTQCSHARIHRYSNCDYGYCSQLGRHTSCIEEADVISKGADTRGLATHRQ